MKQDGPIAGNRTGVVDGVTEMTTNGMGVMALAMELLFTPHISMDIFRSTDSGNALRLIEETFHFQPKVAPAGKLNKMHFETAMGIVPDSVAS